MNIFRNASGKVVIGQKPNLPIIVWVVARTLAFIPQLQEVHEVLAFIAFGALFTWAWMELFDGANVFRRILGGVVLIVILFLGV